MTMAPVDREARHEGSDPAELLIKEARQRRVGVVVGFVLLLA
jgi:hypothetical protein